LFNFPEDIIVHYPLTIEWKEIMEMIPQDLKKHQPKYYCKNCYCIFSWPEEICYRKVNTVFDLTTKKNRNEFVYYLHKADFKGSLISKKSFKGRDI
jgi:hypothetical protein